MSFSNTFLFGIYPYIAFAICVIASCIRFEKEPYSWRADSSQMLRKKNMRWASNWFHIGIIFVLCGHIAGLLTPESVYHYVISTEAKQMVAMVTGGAFGLLCFVGLTGLIVRRFSDERVKANSRFSDFLVLILLYIQLILGLSTIVVSTGHLDGSVMVMLANWAQNIVTFNMAEAVANIAPVHFIYKAHVFLGVTLFVVFPFTRLVHIVSAPVWYFGRKYQLVRQKV
ncbi:respiratory nitrate reductase subunit gamma [Porticoccus sp. GXU_MW_L64]